MRILKERFGGHLVIAREGNEKIDLVAAKSFSCKGCAKDDLATTRLSFHDGNERTI